MLLALGGGGAANTARRPLGAASLAGLLRVGASPYPVVTVRCEGRSLTHCLCGVVQKVSVQCRSGYASAPTRLASARSSGITGSAQPKEIQAVSQIRGIYDPDAMTCREPQRPDDRAAKHLVELCSRDVEVCLHDDGSEPMMYDLDLRWPDGHVEAMEVTIAIDDDLLRLDLRLARHGSVIPAKESTRNWSLMLAPGTTDVRRVRSKADHLLSLVEQAGVTRFGEPDEHRSVAAAAVLRRLGIAYGLSSPPAREQPRITLVGPAPTRFFVQPESINMVVEDHARRNEKKLALSGCDQRHLFVLLDFTSPEGWNAFMEQGEPPELPPRLPEAITAVWVASDLRGRPVVWRVRRAGRWEVLV